MAVNATAAAVMGRGFHRSGTVSVGRALWHGTANAVCLSKCRPGALRQCRILTTVFLKERPGSRPTAGCYFSPIP